MSNDIGIEINTSFGKTQEEMSSLESEEIKDETVEEVIEASEAEQPKEDVIVEDVKAEKIVESQPKPEVEESAPELNEDLVRSKAKELGYLTQEDLEARKEEWLLDNAPKPQEESDFIKRARELESKGYNLNDYKYWSSVTKDYGKYDLNDVSQALDVVLEGYKLEYPNVSEDKLRAKLENDYDALYDNDIDPEDREHKRAKANLDINAETYLSKLKARQEEIKPPMNPQEEQIQLAKQEEQRLKTFLPKAEREFKTKINKYFNENKVYDVKVGDDVVQYEFSKEDVSLLNEGLSNIFSKDYKLLIDENGSIENRVKDEGIAVTVENLVWMNPELRSGIISKMLEHNSAKNKKEVVDEISNTTLPQSTAKPKTPTEDVNRDAYAKAHIPPIM